MNIAVGTANVAYLSPADLRRLVSETLSPTSTLLDLTSRSFTLKDPLSLNYLVATGAGFAFDASTQTFSGGTITSIEFYEYVIVNSTVIASRVVTVTGLKADAAAVYSSIFNPSILNPLFDGYAYSVVGSEDADTLYGGDGSLNETFDGSAGIDTLTYEDAAFSGVSVNLQIGTGVKPGGGIDTILNVENVTGSAQADVLVGNSAGNVLSGGAGNDNIYGNGGDDTLVGGGGDDFIDGGLGVDTAVYSGNRSDYTITSDPVTGWLTVADSLGLDGTDTLFNVNRIQFADQLFSGFTTIDLVVPGLTLIGTEGDDTLTGDEGADTIYGGAGNDRLSGGSDGDTIFGEDGDDFISGGDGSDYLNGGSGANFFKSSSGSDIFVAVENSGSTIDYGDSDVTGITANITDARIGLLNANTVKKFDGIDTISGISNFIGTRFDDVIYLGNSSGYVIDSAGNDIVYGGAGSMVFAAGAGNDSFYGGNGYDVISFEGDDLTIAGAVVQMTDAGVGSAVDSWGNLDSFSGMDLVGGSRYDDIIIGAGGNDNLNGLFGNDYIAGGAGDDQVFGNEGNDLLAGGDGRDRLYGGDGNDIIDSSGGSAVSQGQGDVIKPGLGSNTIIGNAEAYAIFLGGIELRYDDVGLVGGITMRANVDGSGTVVSGHAGLINDTFTYADTFVGTSEDDVFFGGTAEEESFGGGSGNDYINGGSLADSSDDIADYGLETGGVGIIADLRIGEVRDTYGYTDTLVNIEGITGTQHADYIIGDAGQNQFYGYEGSDTLIGGGGDDFLEGGFGDDILRGEGDNDRLSGLAGADFLDGGSGWDKVRYDRDAKKGGAAGVTVNLAEGWAIDGFGNTDTLISIEDAQGTDLADIIIGSEVQNNIVAGGGNDLLSGGLGNDYIDAGAGTDTVTYAGQSGNVIASLAKGTATGAAGSDQLFNVENLIGGNGNDTLTGNAAANTLTGGVGNDTLNGATGADRLVGGLGNDTYVTDGLDTITEAATAGSDTVQSSVTYTLGTELENLTLTGASGINGTGNTLNNVITGNSGANTLTGGAGNDTLNGGTGNDRLIGGVGNDIYVINGGDTIVEAAAAGTDTVQSTVAYTLGLNFENLSLTGPGIINGTGNTLNNVITGNGAANTLNGGTGNDRITGGLGKDTLVGGVGTDTFVFNKISDSTTVASTWDIITDFTKGQDKIDLRGIDAFGPSGANDAFLWKGAAAFSSASAGETRYQKYDNVGTANDYTVVFLDNDADTAVEMAIRLHGLHNLAATDFMA
jgi:Ca2+-binding RTX toxin-like protein